MTQIVRALIVTDSSGGFHVHGGAPGGIDTHFHLGEFVSVLQGTAWEGFTLQITKAHRGGSAGLPPSLLPPPTLASTNADLIDFDFSTHDLSPYDMILLFPIAPDGTQLRRTGPVDVSSDATPAELAAIAAFMQAGGGVFATGDHEDLGAGLCKEIPRVRNMRRWYFGNVPTGLQPAPNGGDATRLDTLRSGLDATFQFDDQSDSVAQEILPARHFSRTSRYIRQSYPHPLLCCPLGVVRHLPDHAHEGICEIPPQLDLSTLGVEEYPVLGGSRLAPEVVAQATVIPGHATGSKPPVDAAQFGVIGAWDGHRVDRGRVVVDATWHHFFNINLVGDLGSPNADKHLGFHGPRPAGQADHYESIKWYFRNIVYWLVPKGRTVFLLREAIWRAVHTGPFFEEFPHWRNGGFQRRFDWQLIFDVAQITKAYFDRVRGGCFWLQLLPIVLEPLPRWRRWWEEIGPLVDPWQPFDRKLREPRWIDPRLAIDANVLADAVIGAHTLALIQAAATSGPEDAKRLHATADELFGKMLEASLAEAGQAFAAARREMAPLRKALEAAKG